MLPVKPKESVLHIMESTKTLQEVEKALPQAAAKHKFGVLGIHNLKAKMNEKGVPFENECLIFEVCNPNQAKKILDNDLSVSTILPCRISAYKEQGKVKIATLKPTAFIELFEKQDIRPVADEVERTLIEIMKELS